MCEYFLSFSCLKNYSGSLLDLESDSDASASIN